MATRSRFRDRSEATKMLQITAVFVAALIALAFVAALVVSSTDWGHERVRRFLLTQLQGNVHGRVTVGRVRGNLMNGITMESFAIRDSVGEPFLVIEEVRANYSLLQLLAKHLDLRNVTLVRPLIVLDRQPKGKWNYQRIFPAADTTKPGYVRRQGFPWIVLHDVAMLDGHLIMRSPWHPDTSRSRAHQDSSIRDALGGVTRLMVIPVPTGYQKIIELREITASAPLVRIAQPGFHDRLAQIASLKMEALPFRPPTARVLDLAGNMRFNNDSIWWKDVSVRMPGSSLRGDGRYVFNTGDMTITARGRPASFADFRFVYPRFPSSGGGPLDFLIEWRGTTQDYIVRNADVHTQGAHLVGEFAVTFSDTVAIHDTDIRFTNLSTKLVEQMAPDFVAPRRGTLDGRLNIVGGWNLLRVSGDLAYHDQGDGTSHLRGVGGVGIRHGEITMRDLKMHADPMQMVLLKSLGKGAVGKYLGPIGGTLTGDVTLNGSTETAITVAGDVDHRDRGGVSQLTGSATMGVGANDMVDVNLQAHPLSLAEVGLFAPQIGLRGSASGPIRLRGTLGNMLVAVALKLPDGGSVNLDGRADMKGASKSYDLAGSLHLFNLNTVVASAPVTSITATANVRGSGFSLASINGAVAADFSASTWNDITIDKGSIRATASNGVARVERLTLHGAGADVAASGTFGLAPGRSGELRYTVAVDSLSSFRRWIPGTADTGLVLPRPALVISALARARTQQLRLARETEVERAATGRPMPRVVVDTPHAIARSAVSGSLYAGGTLTGNIRNFDLRGRLSADNLLLSGNSAKTLRAEYAWTNARTSDSRVAIALEGREITAHGFAFDTLAGRLSYHKPGGEIQLAVRQGDQRDYSMNGSFVLGPKRELRMRALALRMDTTVWRLAHEAVFHFHPGGMELHDFEMRSNKGGLLYANGMLPSSSGGSANLVIEVRNFQVADISDLLQSDLALHGILAARGVVQGTLRDPTFKGAAALANGNYNGSVIPNIQTTFTYSDALLVAHAEAVRSGRQPAAVVDARLPINLALSGVTGSRLLDLPMSVRLEGDSLPLDIIPGFTDMVASIRGRAMGTFSMTGTMQRPAMSGALTLTNGAIKIVSTGMVVNNIAGSIRMTRDTVFVDSIAGQSGGGPVRVTGRMYVGNWRAPSFDLHIIATDAQVLNNDRGHLDADVGLSITGLFSDTYITGLVVSKRGVLYVPESTHKNLVNAGDPALFAVMDTSVAYDRELFPTSSPFLEHLRIDVDVTVNRDTWLRSRDANIEMFTEEPIRVHREADALALTGVILTDRGEYTFLSKRFAIKRGSATFVGGPEMNPTLQAAGEYQVVVVGRPNFNIRVMIGGTISKPKLSLESDAQPPISQSDLLSYLAFGRSASTLLQLEGSGLTGQSSTGNLIGVGAALAMKRMTAVALGVMADEVEGEATKGLGADVFDITPADLPTELGAQNFVGFLQSTRVEAGKYVTPNLFVALQAQQYPGARLEWRTNKGWRFETSIEPRYLLQPPRLALQPISPVSAFGAFIIREWRF